jgi:hypothetical protein
MYTPDIDHDIPLAEHPPTYADLRDRVDAAMNALAALTDEVPVSDADIAMAQAAITGATKNTEAVVTRPGAVAHIKAILSEYDMAIVESAKQIRTFVTNKLLIETTHPDAKIRLRAYEMLGKISDVGLFTEKTEITMRHRPTEELEQMLRDRLARVQQANRYVQSPLNDPAQPLVIDVEELTPSKRG